jgi:hypothetical protein
MGTKPGFFLLGSTPEKNPGSVPIFPFSIYTCSRNAFAAATMLTSAA